jgi:hypothetical protein
VNREDVEVVFKVLVSSMWSSQTRKGNHHLSSIPLMNPPWAVAMMGLPELFTGKLQHGNNSPERLRVENGNCDFGTALLGSSFRAYVTARQTNFVLLS